MSILNFIENKDLNLKKTNYYAAILGESPSKGAKSPLLWNAAFKELNISGMMHPMDIAADNLKSVVNELRDDERFIGGAVTMPYKINIIPYLDSLEAEAKTIGAVNCLYRDGKKLIGTNTDGAGALWSIQNESFGSLFGKKVLLLGTGGAGLAVAAYVASALGSEGSLFLANRSQESKKNLIERIYGKCYTESIDWPVTHKAVKEMDIVINCSSIGFGTVKHDDKGAFSLKYYTPLGPVNNSVRISSSIEIEKEYIKAASEAIAENVKYSMNILAEMRDPYIFDIIYQPRETMLISLAKLMGYKILNGVSMNLEQAVIAFCKATEAAGLHKSNSDKVRNIMKSVY